MSRGGFPMAGGPRESPPSSKGVRGLVARVALDTIVSRSFSVLLSAGSELHHKKAAAALAFLLLTACGDKPVVVTTIDTLCTVTTRYHASDAQVAALKADPGLWGALVDWLRAFNIERDKRCLQPAKGA